jgi:hypothetical protein
LYLDNILIIRQRKKGRSVTCPSKNGSIGSKLTRSFIIEKSKLIQNNNGKVSKQTKLYEYIMSSADLEKWRKRC